jgi:hypothetical protein
VQKSHNAQQFAASSRRAADARENYFPGSVDCPGFIFMAVKTLFLVTQILPECVSRQSHCSNIRMAAKMAATDSIIISYHVGCWVSTTRSIRAATQVGEQRDANKMIWCSGEWLRLNPV